MSTTSVAQMDNNSALPITDTPTTQFTDTPTTQFTDTPTTQFTDTPTTQFTNTPIAQPTDKQLRIYHKNKYIDIPIDIINRYPDSPLYTCINYFSDETIHFESICSNFGGILTFGLFTQLCDVICGRCLYLDTSKKVRDLLKIFNLVDPFIETIYENNYNNLLAEYNDFCHLMNTRGSVIEVSEEKYKRNYQKILLNPNIIPIQIIRKNDGGVKGKIVHIGIYDGLPIYDDMRSHIDEIFILDKFYFVNHSIDINQIRLQIWKKYYYNIGSERLPESEYLGNNLPAYIHILHRIHIYIGICKTYNKYDISTNIFKFPTNVNIDKLIKDVINIVFESGQINEPDNEINVDIMPIYGFVNLPQ